MPKNDQNLFLESGSEQNPQPIPAAQKGWEERDGRYFVNSSNMTARERELMGRSAARMKITLGTLNVRAKNNVDTISAITNQAVESAVETLDTERERVIAVQEQALAQQEASELRVKANTDELTGLYSRRKILEILKREIFRSIESNEDLSILMFDIDNFKAKNDIFGHDVGDQVLQQVANVLIENTRPTDSIVHGRHVNGANRTLVNEESQHSPHNRQTDISTTEEPGRFGGEELLIVTRKANSEQALMVAERLRTEIEKLPPNTKPEETVSLPTTTSVGVGTLTEIQKNEIRKKRSEIEVNDSITDKKLTLSNFISNEIIPQMLKQADRGLYYAKQNGRNQSAFVPSDPY